MVLTLFLVLLIFLQNGEADVNANLFSDRSGGFAAKTKIDPIVKLTGIIGLLFMINSLCISRAIYKSHSHAIDLIKSSSAEMRDERLIKPEE